MTDYRNFDVVYADAEEKYVKTVVLYAKTSDNYVYSKAAAAEGDKIDKDTLLELCKKGSGSIRSSEEAETSRALHRCIPHIREQKTCPGIVGRK